MGHGQAIGHLLGRLHPMQDHYFVANKGGWSSLLLSQSQPGCGETKAQHRQGFFMVVAVMASSYDDPDVIVVV